MDATYIITVVSAVAQVVQLSGDTKALRKYVDDRNSDFTNKIETFNEVEEGKSLASIIPPYLLQEIKKNVKQCWEKYYEIINTNVYQKQVVTEETEVLKKCICEELIYIKKLSKIDKLPIKTLQNFLDKYNCELGVWSCPEKLDT